jgi:hypothetical protein
MPVWHAPGGVRRAFHCLSAVFRSATGKHCTEDAGTAERVAAKGQAQARCRPIYFRLGRATGSVHGTEGHGIR